MKTWLLIMWIFNANGTIDIHSRRVSAPTCLNTMMQAEKSTSPPFAATCFPPKTTTRRTIRKKFKRHQKGL